MNISHNQFALIVAFLLPGFIGLVGIAPFVPLLATWLKPQTYAEASLGAPVYVLLAATTMGMLASSTRWLIVDHLHELTGLKRPTLDDKRLDEHLDAYKHLVDSHYRYYQSVANSLIAVIFSYGLNRVMATSPRLGIATDLAVLGICCILFAASRDALSKYYARTSRLIGTLNESKEV